MKKIYFFSPNLNLKNNLAIVGSANSLLNTNYGNKIDTYEEILRFNIASTKSFEEHVGSRTTLRLINNHVFLDKLKHQNLFDNDKNLAVISPIRFSKEEITNGKIDLKNYFFCDNKINQYFCCFFFIKYFSLFKNLITTLKKKNFSIGFYTILLCIISGIKPDIYGFDINEDTILRSHYFRKNFPIGGYHDLQKEHLIIDMLKDENLLNIF